MRTLVSSRRDQYVETFTAKLLTYALGRLVDYRDQPAIRKIARDAAAQDHRWSAIISGIVKSAPFRMAATAAHWPLRIEGQEKGHMFITKRRLSRRTVLRGMGATVALPLLDSMVPAMTALAQTAAKPVQRFGAVYVPNGVIPAQWYPADRRRGIRIHAHAQAARAVSRSPARGQRPRQRAAAATG